MWVALRLCVGSWTWPRGTQANSAIQDIYGLECHTGRLVRYLSPASKALSPQLETVSWRKLSETQFWGVYCNFQKIWAIIFRRCVSKSMWSATSYWSRKQRSPCSVKELFNFFWTLYLYWGYFSYDWRWFSKLIISFCAAWIRFSPVTLYAQIDEDSEFI